MASAGFKRLLRAHPPHPPRASPSFSSNETKDEGISGQDSQAAVKLRWNNGDAHFHSGTDKDLTLAEFGKVFQNFSNGISASSSSHTNEGKEAGISSQDFQTISGQDSHAISSQDSLAISGQDSDAISGQESDAISSQDAQVIAGQASRAISGQDSRAVVKLKWNYGDAHFQPHLEKEGLVFIKFFVPHCKICTEISPVWEKLSNEFEGLVTVAEMDCEGDNLIFCERYKIDAYPTLFLFWHGKPLQEYHGKHDFDQMSNFLKHRLDGSNNKPFDWRDRFKWTK